MTIKDLIEKAQYVTDRQGNPTAVQLDIATWQELLTQLAPDEEALEDELLVQSGLLPVLIKAAQKEQPSTDWERELGQL